MITKVELAHAHSVIDEIMGDPDDLLYAAIEIDETCGWCVPGEERCGAPVQKACVLFAPEQKGQVEVVAYCDHHAACMTEAARSRRQKN